MKCPFCNTDNSDTNDFCDNCGAFLKGTTTTATVLSGSAPAVAVPLAGAHGGVSGSLAPGGNLQNGRYVIKKVLGQGGMGAAVLATDTRVAGKPVVIKELISENTDPTKRQEDVRNFEREVETVAFIDHPLVPNVTDHFQEGSHYFMVQEYVDGENLEKRMERLKSSMPEKEALNYASQVLDILDYLSQQKPPIVHRDIKPANIIIGAKDKRAHLVDFGIARADIARNVKRKQTEGLGTPGYAPPEQYQGNADVRSDLYALAATIHYLLTNRDPCEHAPFVFPPVRRLNSQLSPEIEQILTRALTMDSSQRYQSAAAMKQDIDDILLNRFGVSGNTGSFTTSTFGSSGASTLIQSPTQQPTTKAKQSQQPPLVPRPITPPPLPIIPQPNPYSPVGTFRQQVQPPPRQPRSPVVRIFLLFIVAIFLIGALFALLVRSPATGPGTTGISTPTIALPNGIGVAKATNGEFIGISDGTFSFDTASDRLDSALKAQAAEKLKMGDVGGAESLWHSGLLQDPSDAEALIYLEDQRVLSSGSPYITLVVGTMLTGTNVGVGRDNLQGAYIAQKQFNDGHRLPNNMQVRLLIANSGTAATDATTVAQQIVQAAQQDKTIVGVMGWPFSSRAVNVVGVLAKAQIPLVSQTASSDQLTGISSYFFRVAPSNKDQGIAGAHYAEQVLHARNVALFVDPADSYSSTLAQDFSKQFQADGNNIVVTENYTVGTKGQTNLPTLLQDALNHNPSPDLIYFSGYAADISELLTNLPTTGPFAKLQILGGDALYELNGYSSSAHANFSRLHLTSFAYPDEWDFQRLTAQKPAFFADYASVFNPDGKHSGYGYTRTASDVMLSYDATLALLTGSKIALNSGGSGKKSITANELQQGLTQIKGAQTLQGVSGPIQFGLDGNPINKPVVILSVDSQGRIQEERLQGSLKI